MKAPHIVLSTLLASIASVRISGQTIVTFGDSLTDNGYGAKYVQKLLNTTEVYPAPPYYEGRFSNGRTWIEYAAAALGVVLEGYAMGGAAAGATPSSIPPFVPPFAGLTEITPYNVPSVGEQVGFFLDDHDGVADPDNVYVIAGGQNDISQAVELNVTAPMIAEFIEDAVQTLYSAGARKFVLVVPNDAATEILLAGTPVVPAISTLTTDYLIQLADLVAKTALLPGATAQLFDFGQAQLQALANGNNLGITNTSACHDPVIVMFNGQPIRDYSNGGGYTCSDPDSHSSWDSVHPTEPLHKSIGGEFVAELGPVFWSSTKPAAGVPITSTAAHAPAAVEGR